MNHRFVLDEVAKLAALAGPLTATALVNMGISITDVIMMGWLGPLELATGAVTSDFYSIVFYLAAGVVAAVAPIISQARGADDTVTIRRATQQGIWAAWLVSIPGFALIWNADVILGAIGVQTAIVEQMPAYAHWMALSFVFMTGVGLWRNFLAAHDITKVIFYITAAALPINALGNYVLMFGHFGAPALGLAGAGISSAITAAFILVTLYMYCVSHRSLRRYRLLVGIMRSDMPRLGELFRIGVPIGITNLSELGIFLFATVMIGMVSVEALAAHAVALRMAGLVYALPLGLSQAATVRVGFHVGAGNRAAMHDTITTASIVAVAIGACVFIGLIVCHSLIPGWFINRDMATDALMAQAATLLILLAIMQPFENICSVCGGILRGLKDTRIPMVIAVSGYWGIAFPIMLVLVFALGLDAIGIWVGLLAGMALVTGATCMRLWRQLGDRRSISALPEAA